MDASAGTSLEKIDILWDKFRGHFAKIVKKYSLSLTFLRVRPSMDQSSIIRICSKRGYSSGTQFSNRARSPIVTCRRQKELLHIKGFITGFKRACKSCQAKTEDDEAGESSTRLLSLFLHHLLVYIKISMLIRMQPLVFAL